MLSFEVVESEPMKDGFFGFFVAFVPILAYGGVFAEPYEPFSHSIGCGGVGLCVSPDDLPFVADNIERVNDPCPASRLGIATVREFRSII